MNNNQLDITYIKKCFLMSQKAEAVPPLGTILGNIGVNTIKFCEEFNNYTTELPQYFVVRVIITVYENRSFSFIIIEPTTSFFLNILKFEKKIKVKVHDR
jgi:ribosomal protein L11